MAAWKHSAFWGPDTYEHYRAYVIEHAPLFRGRSDLDCADMSLTLLIEFAARNALPVTLRNDDNIRLISKSTRQTPTTHISKHKTYAWKTKEEYLQAVINRLNAKSVFNKNTLANPRGPEPGDLMCKPDHTSLVFKVYPPRLAHPRANDKNVPIFPGAQKAKFQIRETEYFREDPAIVTPHIHFDYLNHRGEGKEAAELIYFADAQKMQLEGFQFRMYKPEVRDNWFDWTGEGDPPR
jgi:hypothetical protein